MVFHGLEDSLEIEPPLGGELDFEGPGRSKFQFFPLGAPSDVIFCFVDAQLHTSTPLGAPGPPNHDQRGSQSRFSPPLLGPFSDFRLLFFAVFHRL